MGETENVVGTRYRLVSTQGGKPHVSSVVLSEEEAREMLDIEEDIHRKWGWTVTRGEDVLVCRKLTDTRMVERVLTIRRSGPLDDAILD
jgi:uncharacterized protein (DUF849 family)